MIYAIALSSFVVGWLACLIVRFMMDSSQQKIDNSEEFKHYFEPQTTPTTCRRCGYPEDTGNHHRLVSSTEYSGLT